MTIPQTIAEWLHQNHPHYKFEPDSTLITGTPDYKPSPSAPLIYYIINDKTVSFYPGVGNTAVKIDLADPEMLDKINHLTTKTLKPTTAKAAAIHATACYLKRHRPHHTYQINRNSIHAKYAERTTHYRFQGKTVTVHTPLGQTTLELSDPKYYSKLPRP